MIRTQIYLPEEYVAKIAAIAQRQSLPKAVVIRRILKKAIKPNIKTVTPSTGNSLLNLAKKLHFKGGPRDLSEHFDDYLYGDRK